MPTPLDQGVSSSVGDSETTLFAGRCTTVQIYYSSESSLLRVNIPGLHRRDDDTAEYWAVPSGIPTLFRVHDQKLVRVYGKTDSGTVSVTVTPIAQTNRALGV